MNYSLEELAEKIRSEYKNTGMLSEHLQACMKEVAENIHPNNIEKFSDVLLPVYLDILNGPVVFMENSENQCRALILELLNKILLGTNNFGHYERIFHILLDIMQRDNENNGITAARLLSDILKSTTQLQFNFESVLRPLFSNLASRAQMFLSRVEDIVRNPAQKHLYQLSQPPQKLIKSSDSIKLIMEIPNLFVYACHFVEPNNEFVKNCLHNAINNFINTLRIMPYQELAKNAPKLYFSEMINTVVKLFHFITLILKQQITNEKIREYLHSQTETIKAKAEDMVECIMSFFRNVHDDFTSSRIELINYMRFHVKYLGPDKFKNSMNFLFEDDVIFGKQKFKSIYGKNLIYQHWLETMQHLVNEMTIPQISKTFDIIAKNLYDNNLYNNIQYHSLVLHQKIMEVHFQARRGAEGQEHTQKVIATKILEKLILKFKHIKEKIVEINNYLGTKYPNHENPEKNPILLSSLPAKGEIFSEEDEEQWNKKKLGFIDAYDLNVDNYLFSQSWIHYKTINIYEDEDELIINCWTINPNTVNEYLKEIKEKIVPALFDSIRSVINFISSNVTYPFNQPPGGQPRPQGAKLTEEECYLLGKLLKYGLICMDLLHNYKNPTEDREKMLSFFIIFVGLQEPKNIKDIFETNFKSLFDITLKYAKYGTEESLQNLLSPLIDGPKVYEKSTEYLKLYSQQINQNWKIFAEIMIRQLFIKLENSPDELGPFHPYYEYQHEYHSIIYKLIKMCFRCLNKHQQDQFIEGIFKQIIMVLFKKTHSSKYSIEYILLLRNLFKNILNQKSDNLFVKFQQLCEYGPSKIDIIKNFVALYQAGLSELNDVLSELILILPLRTKYLLFNSKMLISPIISALNLTDSDFLKRGLKTIDVILNNYQNYQNEDLENLLVDVKHKLINKLYFFMWNAQESDILYATSKLLGKLGHYPRTHKVKQKFLPLNSADINVDMKLVEIDGKVEVNMSLVEAISLSIELIEKFFENKSLVPVKVSCFENAWVFLQSVVHKLIEKEIDSDELRNAALNSNWGVSYPQYGNKENYDIINEIFRILLVVASHAKRKELEEMFQNIANVFVLSYIVNPDKEDPKNLFFLYSIIDNIKYRIIYIRGSHNDTYFNNTFSIIKTIIEKIQNICTNSETDFRIYYLIILRLVRVCHTKELINCHGAINCLISLADLIPSRYFVAHYFDIIDAIFNVIQKIPVVIQLPVFDKCLELLKIMAKFYPILSEHSGLYHICDSLVNELLSANENQHEAAKFFLKQISKETNVKFPLMFFETERGGNRLPHQRLEGDVQMQVNKADLIKENLPISKLLIMQDKIFSELSTKKIQKENHRYLYQLRNAIDTLNLLMSERILPFRFVDEKESLLTEDMKKLIALFEAIIAENDKIYKPYVYIIMEEEKKPDPVVHQQQPPPGQGQQQPPAAQNYTINKNILYDDDEFNVNIEDVDLNVKVWSKVISSALVLMQNVMTHRLVNMTIKVRINRRDRHDRTVEEVNETRNKVIFKFFNMMLRIERTIRKTASRGLKTLIKLENQPKDLLTEDNLKVILRPILICLQQQHQIFNIPFLNVLRKLVKYLNQCFNRTLSDKLAEHLTKFMEVLCAGNRRYQGPEPVVDERKIASGIFYLFEYLPHASQYVDLIIKLNNKIDNTIVQLSGMYYMNYLMRKPLLRIVNCYASGSVELFLTNLKDYSKVFLYVLKADCSHAIRERLMRETQNFLERTFHSQSVFDLTSEAIRIIRIISKRNPSCLLKNKIIPTLLTYWNNKDLKQQPADDEFAKDRNRDEISQILKIFVQYCKSNRKEIKIIFDILPIFNMRHSTDFSFLHKFYRYYIPENYASEEKRDIFLYFLEYIKNPNVPIETKANASYILVYPMMLKCFKSGKARDMFPSRVLDEVCSLVSELVRKKPTEYGRLEIEILQICGLVITYLKDEYMNQQGGGDDRKIDLLRLGWNLMKNEDKIYANIAKLFICKFISKYGLLYEQTMQLYVSLLKGQEYINSHDNDIKLLSRKALDILIPYLPNVRSQNDNPNAPPKWVTWTCRIFNEENWVNAQGYSFARFWQVFIRMHKIFAKYKNYFSTQMINSMQYLVLPHHQSSMYKKIAIDLALLYMEWHYHELKEKLDKETELDRRVSILNLPFNEQNKDIKEIFVNFFIKLAINSCQDKEEKENITRKALFLLKKWLIISNGTVIKYQFIEKTLNNAQGSSQLYNREGVEKKKSCFTVLMIISTLLDFDRTENIQANMDLIFKILTHPFSNCFTCDNPYIIQLISNLTKKLLALNNPSFQAKIIDLVESGVNAYIQAYQSRSSNQNQFVKNAITIYTTIRISKVLLEHRPEELDKFFEAFLQISRIFIELFDNRKFYNTPTTRKAGEEDEDLLANIDNHYTEEGFENHKFSFSNLREFLIILLRILSQKLTKFSNPDSKEKMHMIELLESIMEKLPDIDLTVEVLSILNSLLLSDYYSDVKSHIPLVRGCFTTKEKILYFLDCKKVQYIMDKHFAIRHHDSERVVRKYSKLIIDLLRAIPLKEIEMERLRKLIVILNKYVPTDMSDQLFQIVDNHFGDSFKKKIMFFFYEFSDETHLEEHSEGDEDLLSTVVNYLVYMLPQHYDISGPTKVFPFSETFQNSTLMLGMQVENTHLDEYITQLNDFMKTLRSYPITDLLTKFRKLLTVEYSPKREILRFYFNFLFTLVWQKLPRSDQQVVWQALESYLTNRNCSVSANAILYAAENLYPSVKLKPEIIQFLAKTNYTWHTSLYLLEKYSELETDEELENSILSLIELYTRLDDKDYCYGLKRLICNDERLKKALTLSQHRLWVKAGKGFSSYIENTGYNPSDISDVLNKRIAEEGWMNVHKQLNDWGNIQNIIKDIGNVDLHIELAWQTKEKRTLEKFIQSTETFNADTLMIQSILRLSQFAETIRQDENVSHKKIDESVSGSLYCSLLEWNALPKYFINSHRNILVRIQSLVEIDEASSIISKIREKDNIDAMKEHFAHQLIAHMDIWKSRMPSKIEDLTVWKTIVDQRNYLYNLIKKRLDVLLTNVANAANAGANPPGSATNTMPSTPSKEASIVDVEKKLGYFSDIIWNNLKYASIERRFDFFGQMKGGNRQLWNEAPQTPGEIYMSMKEQIMWRLNSHFDYENALRIANNAINHELLSIEHKSEMHRLKVLLNMQLGRLEDANNECIEALKICDTNWKCWHTWAVFCFRSFCHKNNIKWAEQTVVCFMNAIKYKPHKTRLLVADILWMLTYDDRIMERQKIVLAAFEKAVKDLPVWIWILWIPQFLAAIIKNRAESKASIEVLKRIAKEYPQAIYYYLRRFKQQTSTGHSGNYEEVYEEMKKSEPTLFECLEAFSEFIPSNNITQEERMINEINNLVTSLYMQDSLAQLDKFRLRIFLMLRSFEQHIKRIPFTEVIRMQSANLSEILGILKIFINNMRDNYKQFSKPFYKIEAIKLMKLQSLMSDLVEVPGQYNANHEPFTEKHVKILEVGNEIESAEKSRLLRRILSFKGTNEKTYQYMINNRPPLVGGQQESLVIFLNTQLKQIMNIRFASNKETAQRYLKLKGLAEHFMNTEVSLVEYKPKLKSMSDLLDEHLVSKELDIDMVLEMHLKENTFGNPIAKQDIYKRMDKIVPNNLLKKFTLKSVKNLDEYFLFRNNFTRSYGMENFFSYVISNDLMLEHMFIDAAKGTFYYMDLKPTFSEQGQISKESSLSSMRISKNIENFITNMGLEGLFASCFISSSLAFTRYDTDLSTILFVYVRDCLMKMDQPEIGKKELMDNAEELKQRITSFGFEKDNTEEISEKIYKTIVDLTNAQNRIQIPKKFKYWF